MYHNMPQNEDAFTYARSDMKRLAREIIRLEGINNINRMNARS